MNLLNPSIDLEKLASEKKNEYQNAKPFPSIVFHDFFDETFLTKVLDEFPDLSAVKKNVQKFDNHNERKLAGIGESLLGDSAKQLIHFLNSEPVLQFLQELTGIKETLLPDPYLFGGGYHEIKPGGVLKIHADFNKHNRTNLDRRLNLLVYLNKDWQESYGGHFELWDKTMTHAEARILPTFNTVAIFSTTDFSYHGHPNALTCPPDRSRKSIALYYYSNGRPQSEVNKGLENHTTLYVGRKGVNEDIKKVKTFKQHVIDFIPPIIYNAVRRKNRNV